MRNRQTRGLAIAVTLIVMLILSVIAGTIALLSIEHMNQVQRNEEQLTVMHIAEGGLNLAMANIYANTAWQSDGSGQFATRLSQAEYWWTFQSGGSDPWCVNNIGGTTAVTGPASVSVPPGTALLVVQAARGGQQDPNPTRLAAIVSPLYPALAVDGRIDVGGDVTSVRKDATVYSNKVNGSPNIDIDLTFTGQAFSRDASGSIDYQASGSRAKEYYDQPPFPIPDIPIATIVAGWGVTPPALGPNGGPAEVRLTLTSSQQGSYDLTVNGNNMSIAGQNLRLPDNGNPQEVTVFIDARKGAGGASGSGTVRIKDNIPRGVHFFILGDVTQLGGVSVGQTANNNLTAAPSPRTVDPTSNYLFASGDVDFAGAGDMSSMKIFAGGDITLNGNSTYTGFVYVENGPDGVDFNGGSNTRPYQGIAVVRTGDFDMDQGNKDFIYDPAQMPRLSFFNMKAPVRTLSWWVWDR